MSQLISEIGKLKFIIIINKDVRIGVSVWTTSRLKNLHKPEAEIVSASPSLRRYLNRSRVEMPAPLTVSEPALATADHQTADRMAATPRLEWFARRSDWIDR
jgi:hypothetical protein